MSELRDLHQICALSNVGPNRVPNPINPNSCEFRCSRLAEIVDIETVTENNETTLAQLSCDLVVSYAATDGYPEGYVSRITDKGERTRCRLMPHLKVGEGVEHNPPKADSLDFLGSVAAEIEIAETIMPEGIEDFVRPEHPIVDPGQEK